MRSGWASTTRSRLKLTLFENAGFDSAFNRHFVAGLRVCDASLMPTIPCANLNIPVLMLAEKISSHIAAGD